MVIIRLVVNYRSNSLGRGGSAPLGVPPSVQPGERKKVWETEI